MLKFITVMSTSLMSMFTAKYFDSVTIAWLIGNLTAAVTLLLLSLIKD